MQEPPRLQVPTSSVVEGNGQGGLQARGLPCIYKTRVPRFRDFGLSGVSGVGRSRPGEFGNKR